MARNEERIQTPTDKKTETVVQLSSGAIPEVTLPQVDNDHRVKGSAVGDTFEDDRPAAAPAVFGIVVETKLVHCNRTNGRVTMRAGKIVSSKEYDLSHLARQGLKMRKHEPEQALPLDQLFVE